VLLSLHSAPPISMRATFPTRRSSDLYEVDALYNDPPARLTRLAHSPFPDQGRTRYSDMTIYVADNGAVVFASGSMQWNWGLDDRSEEHTSVLQSLRHLVCRLLLEKKK